MAPLEDAEEMISPKSRRRHPATRRYVSSGQDKHRVLFELERLLWERAKARHPNISRFLKDLIIQKLLEEGAITPEELRKALFP